MLNDIVQIMVDAYRDVGALLRAEKNTAQEYRTTLANAYLQFQTLNTLFSRKFVEHVLLDAAIVKKIILHKDDESDDEDNNVKQQDPSLDELNEELSLKRSEDETDADEEYIERYLKLTVIWSRACFGTVKLPLPVRAHRVLFPRPPQSPCEDLQSNVATVRENVLNHRRILAHEPHNYDYSVELQTLFEPLQRPSQARARNTKYCELPALHAKAVLMGLAYSNKIPDDLDLQPTEGKQVIQAVFQDSVTRIGVSKKCCWCCWKLSSIPMTFSESSLNLELPGCHSAIFPWSPPPLLPIEVLLMMKKELINATVTELLKTRVRALSNQSSARSSGDSPDSQLEVSVARAAEGKLDSGRENTT